MRKTQLQIFTLALGLLDFSFVLRTSASGQVQAQTTSPPIVSTTNPSNSNSFAHPDWNQECLDRVKKVAEKRVDILFIGDSITQNWTGPDWGGERRGLRVWNEYYAERYALNFGVGADATQNVLWRMDAMPIRGLHPKVAVVLIGVNNFQDNSAQEIASGIRAILDKTQLLFPDVKIILVSILPNRRSYQKMLDVNAITKIYADDHSIFYMDLVPLFVPLGDNWIGMGGDHLHPNEVGYKIWAHAMQPLLDKLLLAGDVQQ